MTITINNNPTETTASTVQDLCTSMNLPSKGVAVAINNKMIPNTDWATTPLTEGMSLVIIKAFCGG